MYTDTLCLAFQKIIIKRKDSRVDTKEICKNFKVPPRESVQVLNLKYQGDSFV